MSKADRTIACWLCLVGLLICSIIVIVRYAANHPPISAFEAAAGFVVTTAFSVGIGAILFGLATDRI